MRLAKGLPPKASLSWRARGLDEVPGLEARPRLRCTGKQSLKLQDLDVNPDDLVPIAQQLLMDHDEQGSDAGDGYFSDEELADPMGHGGALV